MPTKRLLVIGEVGDGKSTLVNALRDPAKSDEAPTSRKPRGTTKQICKYIGKKIAGSDVELLDTPGVGDSDTPVQKLFVLLEQELTGKEPIDCVIVTTPIPECRIRLGLQVVMFLVENGFVGGDDKWKNVILTGTKRDKADEYDVENFCSDVVSEMFGQVSDKTGPYALVEKTDYSELTQAVSRLPNMQIIYEPPSERVIATELAPKMGINIEALSAEMRDLRLASQQMQARLAEEQKLRQKQEFIHMEKELQAKREAVQAKREAEEQRREAERRQQEVEEQRREAERRAEEQRREAERRQQEAEGQRREAERRAEEHMRRLQREAEDARRDAERQKQEAQAIMWQNMSMMRKPHMWGNSGYDSSDSGDEFGSCGRKLRPSQPRSRGLGNTATTGEPCKLCSRGHHCRYAGTGRPGHY